MNTVNTYLNLITSEHRDKPDFVSVVSTEVEVSVRIQEVLASMIPKFDIDLAVGDQLDIDGEWVGLSRNVKVPITGIYFEWDGDAGIGWEFGTWKGEFDPSTGVIPLPNDIYRMLQKGKIAANHWDGTTPGAYAVWRIAFPDSQIVIQDNQDMSMIVGVAGMPLNSLLKALISQGYIPLKPEGVRVTYAFVTVDAPMFGFDIESDNVDGWETGAWGENL